MRWLRAIFFTFLCMLPLPAAAVDASSVPLDVDALDLTRAVDRFVDVGDRIQVSTAPGLDGIVRRIEVRAREADSVGDWVVFALTNTSDEQIHRVLVAPHFRLANSRIIWPDLGASRLVNISTSQGFAPERLQSQEADVFRITLDPGAVVTYVVELRTANLPQLILWEEAAYRDSVNATTLYKGIVLGIAGLLALFLTILFVVKRSAMFPAVAGVAWAVLAYLAIEFGFWNQVFDLQPGEEQVSRAIAEVVLAATLVLLLYAYLSLGAVHSAFFRIGLVWAAFFSALLGMAVYEPQIAAGIARLGLGVIGVGGLMVIVPMALSGYDRAVHLIPSWTVFLGWLFAAWLAVSGHVVNDFVSPALAGGLVLIVLLLGFTVMQHAFSGGTLAEGRVSDSERKVLALSGSGDLIWDWDLARDRVYSSPATEDLLGLKRGSLAGPFQDWISNIHPGERDHFRHVVEMVVESGRGRIDQTLRMRSEDGHFVWFRLRARPVVADEGVFRLIGTMLDVTDMKTTQERLLRDAVHDSLTGLPNRELFLDRVEASVQRARMEDIARPTVVVVNIDHFSQHNADLGVSAADSLLTMIARRIDRLLKPHDTLSRFGGDQFGILLLSEQKPAAIARLTEQIRRALRAPVVFGDDEVSLTVSIGVATFDPSSESAEDTLKDAEIAMAHAKRLGGDRCEAVRPSLREHNRSLVAVEADLRKALDSNELSVFYQPILRLSDRKLAGFEALLRWDHPRHGRMAPAEFVPIAERSGLIIPVGLFVLERAARDLNGWMRAEPSAAGLFTSVNVSSRQLLRHDLLNDLRAILARADIPGSALKLELTESLVMENPEYAAQVLSRCRELGVGLSLDDFGTGYSSLSYLQRFPFDTIKIDQSFIKDMTPSEPAVVLRAIVALGHDLEMDIVAEGIESDEVATGVATLGCEYGQGYHFGHPLPAASVLGYLRSMERGVVPVAASQAKAEVDGAEAGKAENATAAQNSAQPAQPVRRRPEPSQPQASQRVQAAPPAPRRAEEVPAASTQKPKLPEVHSSPTIAPPSKVRRPIVETASRADPKSGESKDRLLEAAQEDGPPRQERMALAKPTPDRPQTADTREAGKASMPEASAPDDKDAAGAKANGADSKNAGTEDAKAANGQTNDVLSKPTEIAVGYGKADKDRNDAAEKDAKAGEAKTDTDAAVDKKQPEPRPSLLDQYRNKSSRKNLEVSATENEGEASADGLASSDDEDAQPTLTMLADPKPSSNGPESLRSSLSRLASSTSDVGLDSLGVNGHADASGEKRLTNGTSEDEDGKDGDTKASPKDGAEARAGKSTDQAAKKVPVEASAR